LKRLGNSRLFAQEYTFLPNVTFQVPGGPNQGAMFFVSVPFLGGDSIKVNRTALSFNSLFYLNQPTNGNKPGQCHRTDVVPFLPLVEGHEGVTLSSTSHAGTFRTQLNLRLPSALESVVASNIGTLDTRALAAAAPGRAAALQAADDAPPAGNGTVPAVIYCTFKYF
jgi:hypothetical protein